MPGAGGDHALMDPYNSWGGTPHHQNHHHPHQQPTDHYSQGGGNGVHFGGSGGGGSNAGGGGGGWASTADQWGAPGAGLWGTGPDQNGSSNNGAGNGTGLGAMGLGTGTSPSCKYLASYLFKIVSYSLYTDLYGNLLKLRSPALLIFTCLMVYGVRMLLAGRVFQSGGQWFANDTVIPACN